MLGARKLHLVAGLKLQGTELRKAELDFYLARYIMLAGLSAIFTGAHGSRHCVRPSSQSHWFRRRAGLSYVGMIKIHIPRYAQPPDYDWNHPFSVPLFLFYTCDSIALACSLFNLVLTSFLVVNAQGYMLQGPPDAVHRCVEVLARNWLQARIAVTIALFGLVRCTLVLASHALHATRPCDLVATPDCTERRRGVHRVDQGGCLDAGRPRQPQSGKLEARLEARGRHDWRVPRPSHGTPWSCRSLSVR